EAGIGKTTLLKWFCDEVADAAHVLWGGCDDLVTAAALGPLWDIAAEETGLEAVLRDEDRNPAFRYVLDLLSRSLRPTVIVIEDVQWADEATLDLIRFIGRRIDRTHGLLVLSHRDGEGDGDDSIRMVLGDLPPAAVTRISVQAL